MAARCADEQQQVVPRALGGGEIARRDLLLDRLRPPEIAYSSRARVNVAGNETKRDVELSSLLVRLPVCFAAGVVVQPRHAQEQRRVRQLHHPKRIRIGQSRVQRFKKKNGFSP